MTVFAACGLEDTTHKIRIQNAGAGANASFDLDYAVVNSSRPNTNSLDTITSSITPETSSAPNTFTQPLPTSTDISTSSSSSQSNSVPIGTIVGGVLGLVAALAVIGGILFLWWNKKRKRQQRIRLGHSYNPSSSGFGSTTLTATNRRDLDAATMKSSVWPEKATTVGVGSMMTTLGSRATMGSQPTLDSRATLDNRATIDSDVWSGVVVVRNNHAII